jgi:hypothetical protein
MEALRRAELWGSSTPLDSLAATEILARMSRARNDLKHICDAGRDCPLKVEIEAVSDSIQRLLDHDSSLDLEEPSQEGGVWVIDLQAE